MLKSDNLMHEVHLHKQPLNNHHLSKWRCSILEHQIACYLELFWGGGQDLWPPSINNHKHIQVQKSFFLNFQPSVPKKCHSFVLLLYFKLMYGLWSFGRAAFSSGLKESKTSKRYAQRYKKKRKKHSIQRQSLAKKNKKYWNSLGTTWMFSKDTC